MCLNESKTGETVKMQRAQVVKVDESKYCGSKPSKATETAQERRKSISEVICD